MKLEKGYETIIVFVFISLLIYLKFKFDWLIYLAILLLIIALTSKRSAEMIGSIWFSFSNYFGLMMNYLLMSLIYFIVLVPIAFIQKLAGKNKIIQSQQVGSYFHKRNHLYVQKDIEKPW